MLLALVQNNGNVSRNSKWCNHFGKQFAVSSQTVKIELPYDPAVPFFDMYPRDLKTNVYSKVCTKASIAM